MKKIIAIILTGFMALSVMACGSGKAAENTPAAGSSQASGETGKASSASSQASKAESTQASSAESTPAAAGSETSQSEEAQIVGGWSREGSPAITEEIEKLLEKAVEGLVGAKYTPIAYLGSQLVNGTNHAILCTITPVVPDGKPSYAVVTVYEDLDGNAEITEILDCEAGPEAGGALGGWSAPETPDLTDEAREALEKAAETMLGAEYTPIALLAKQVVNGTNYSILCEVTVTSPGAEPKYVIANVYADLQGNAEMKDTFEFTAAK